MERVAKQTISQRACRFSSDDGHERRHRVDVHDLAECHDLCSAEIALEQDARRGAIGVGRLADEHRRKLDARAAVAHDLQSGILPVHELSAA